MNLTFTDLSPDDQRWIEHQVGSGDFASAGEYVAHLIQEQRNRALKELEAELLKGLEGPSTPITPEFWDDVRRRGYEALRKKRESA